MHSVRIAEKIMQVPENLLIRADQKRTQKIRLAIERMQRQSLLHIPTIDKLIDLPIRVARNVAEDPVPERLRVQPVNRHDREKLFYSPTIGHALEQRKIAEVRVGKQPVQPLQLLRKIIQLFRELLNAPANHPVNALRPTPLLQRQ